MLFPPAIIWSYPPYEAKIVDGKIYARDSQDNKGSFIASYFALRILKELNIPLKKRVKFFLGLDEECEWRCVDYYFEKHPEIPVYGFVPDSYFPLFYAEKGLVVLFLETESTEPSIISIQSGSKENIVPVLAQVVLVYEPHYEALFQQYIQKKDVNAIFTRQNDQITIEDYRKQTNQNKITNQIDESYDLKESIIMKRYSRINEFKKILDELDEKRETVSENDDLKFEKLGLTKKFEQKTAKQEELKEELKQKSPNYAKTQERVKQRQYRKYYTINDNNQKNKA